MVLFQEYNKLTDICNDFRTKTNMNTNYIEYISALIYLKYYENYNNQTFRKIYEDRDNYYISEKIDKAISDMREDIKDEKIFSDIQFSNIVFYRKLGEKNILSKTIEKINEMCNSFPKKFIAEQYELALKQIAMIGDMKNSNELFYTPMEITNTMVNMIVDKKSADVYDPMCSSGNFLINASKLNDRKIKIFGQEENIEYYNILKTRILLNDIEDEEIEYQNNEKNKKIKFDYILSNPPYSKKDWKEIIKYRPIFQEYEISENAVGDYAFVISMLDNLKDDGKMAVLLPHGVLFRENERKVRKNLVEKNEIEAIIGLPENLFYDTRIPVIMMIISKNKTDKNILFIDASNEYKNKRFKNILSEENQNKIVNTYKERKEIEGFSKIVSINQVNENDYNLSIKKYIRKNYVRNNIEQKQLIQQLKNLEDEQDILEENIKDILSILNIKDIEKYEKHEKAKTSKIYYDFDDKKIGNNIKNARIKKSYTQERLAEKLELSCRYISMLERGMTGIRLEMLAKICNVLEVSIDEILK